jgi:hypothetical protein
MKLEPATRPLPECIEGPQAFDTFRAAMKAILTVPKSAMPPSPFKKWTPKKRFSKPTVARNPAS